MGEDLEESPGDALSSGGFAERVMNYFYPVHYQFGMEMERAMSQGRVERKQSAVLWLVYARADPEGWVRRREIVAELSSWFEVSQSKVSRLIHSLATPPLGFLELAGSPDSSRERMVRLTANGRAFVDGMIEAAITHLTTKLGHLSAQELEDGLSFLERAFLPAPRR